MSRWLAIAFVTSLLAIVGLAACRGIAGVEDITYSEGGACPSTTPTLLAQGVGTLDELAVRGTSLYADIPLQGIAATPTDGDGGAPKTLLNNFSYGDYAASSTSLYYSLLSGVTTLADGGTGNDGTGAIHSLAFDGTGDQLMKGNLAFPARLAATDTSVFFVDDVVNLTGEGNDVVYCIGCGGNQNVQPWMTLAAGATDIFVDKSFVYVLADADINFTSQTLLACSVTTPCGATSRAVLASIASGSIYSFASNGTYVWVARDDHNDVIRIDASGMTTTVATNQQGPAGLALDDVNGKVYWGTSTGSIVYANADGTGVPQFALCQQANPHDIVVDTTSLYFAAGTTNDGLYKIAKP